MADQYKVILRITSVTGTCAAGHKIGDEFDLSRIIPVGSSGDGKALCPSAFYAAYPNWRTLRFGGGLPWEDDKSKAHVACPDPRNPVVMELVRVKE